MGMFSLDQKEVFERGERLERYMKSVDDDLRQIASAVNQNFKLMLEVLEALQVELKEIKKELKEVKR